MSDKKTLTVFTPAYNRAHTIGRTYDSLCRQTSKDFEWLIVDDGSTDNTKELVGSWIKENKISIRYIWQENQGMHGAHNTAYRNITSELNTCIDSDDWMPDDAVERIISFWRKNGSEKYAGIMGLDATADDKILGDKFPDDFKETTERNYFERLQSRGDKKLVYRTDVITKYPEYPIFKGEKYVGLGYKYSLIDLDYKLLTSNEVYVIVDYQEDGSSLNMWRQYWCNPRGFAFIRLQDMDLGLSWKKKVVACVHYVSHSIRSGNWHFLKESHLPLLTFLMIPFGACLYMYNKHKVNQYDK